MAQRAKLLDPQHKLGGGHLGVGDDDLTSLPSGDPVWLPALSAGGGARS